MQEGRDVREEWQAVQMVLRVCGLELPVLVIGRYLVVSNQELEIQWRRDSKLPLPRLPLPVLLPYALPPLRAAFCGFRS